MEVSAAPQSVSARDSFAAMVLCLLAALTPLVFAARLFEPYVGAKEVFVQAGTATAALVWLLTTRVSKWKLTLTPAWIPLLMLVLIGSASVIWSSNPSISFHELPRLATYVLLFAISLVVMRHAEARALLVSALVLSGGIEAVYVLLQYSFGDPVFLTGELPGKWQTFGTLGNPNWVGEFLAVTALVCFGRLIDLRKASEVQTHRRWSRHLTLAAWILMLLALMATLARGAWLGFIIGAGGFLIARRYSEARLRLKSFILPLAVSGAAAIVLIALPLVSNRAALNHLVNLKSLRGRVWMSAVTWTMIRDAPWSGHGLGTFGLQFPDFQGDALTHAWAAPFLPHASFTSYAHNDYLQLWAETGLFGLLTFAALIWIVLKRGRALAGEPLVLGCWAAVISIMVNATVAFPLHLPTSLMLFVVLVAVIESAATKKTVDLSSSANPARIAIVLPALILCGSAYLTSYHRLRAETALWRADAALASQRWDEAEAAIRLAVEHAPTRAEGPAMLGRLQLERGDYPQALAALGQAMKLGFDVDVYDWKATALEKAGQHAAAIETLNELARLRPDLTWPRERLSAISMASEKQQENKQ